MVDVGTARCAFARPYACCAATGRVQSISISLDVSLLQPQSWGLVAMEQPMVKRTRKRAGLKRKRSKRPGALSSGQAERRLRAAFPELNEWTIRNNRAALLPYLKRGGETNEKDYDKPGEL